jgi:hypothetical protein
MIQPPKWCKDAVPTTKGWVKNGELLVSRKISQSDIDEFNGVSVVPVVEEVQHEEPQMLNEAPANNTSLQDMTKRELIALGEQNGIKLSMLSTKGKLISVLEENGVN